MPIDDDLLLPISALQHLLFCPRQCALIHLEQIWSDNRLTVEGKHFHERAHNARDERLGNVWSIRRLRLKCVRLGLIGVADIVEFEPLETASVGRPTRRPFFEHVRASPEAWRVTPVEYKRGRPKTGNADRVQLCAQAICLEEMLGVQIDSAMLFYGKTRRRMNLDLDHDLREETVTTAKKLHELVSKAETPAAKVDAKCRSCSLAGECLPNVTGGRAAASFFQRQLDRHLADAVPEADPYDESTE